MEPLLHQYMDLLVERMKAIGDAPEGVSLLD